MIPYLCVLQSPPIVPTMIAEPVALGLVATVKVARVEPAGTGLAGRGAPI
jgi:hypothetical protein